MSFFCLNIICDTDRLRSGELLMDQQRFEEAVEKFDKAFELEKSK